MMSVGAWETVLVLKNKDLGTHETNSYVYRAVNNYPKAGLS